MFKPIEIFKGDDTSAFGTRCIRLSLKTEIDLSNATAEFTLLSFSRSFTTEETVLKELLIVLDSSTTSKFPIGPIFGSLILSDGEGKPLTAATRIPFLVTFPHKLSTGFCVKRLPDAVVEIECGVDYNAVYNKPSINGVEISGDRSGKDYGLNRILPYDSSTTYSVDDQVLYANGLYRCIEDIEEPEEWTSAHWESITGASIDPNAVHYSEDVQRTKEEQLLARTNIDAEKAGTASELVQGHNESTSSHSDIRQCVADMYVQLQARLKDATPDYSPYQEYAIGDFAKHDGSLFACKTAIVSPGETWDPLHWTAMPDVQNLFSSANGSLTKVIRDVVKSICSALDPETSSIYDVIKALKGIA